MKRAGAKRDYRHEARRSEKGNTGMNRAGAKRNTGMKHAGAKRNTGMKLAGAKRECRHERG